MREKMNSTFVLRIVSLFPSLTSFLAALEVVALHFTPITQSVQWVGGSVVVSNQHSLEVFYMKLHKKTLVTWTPPFKQDIFFENL